MGDQESSRTEQGIRQLKRLSQYYLDNSLAPSTRRNYTNAVANYKQFCESFRLDPFPPLETNLIMYVTSLSTHSGHSNIKMHLSAIRYFSIMFASFSPIHTYQKLFYVIKGIKRCQGNSRKKPLRDPITPTMLLEIRSSLFNSLRLFEDKLGDSNMTCVTSEGTKMAYIFPYLMPNAK